MIAGLYGRRVAAGEALDPDINMRRARDLEKDHARGIGYQRLLGIRPRLRADSHHRGLISPDRPKQSSLESRILALSRSARARLRPINSSNSRCRDRPVVEPDLPRFSHDARRRRSALRQATVFEVNVESYRRRAAVQREGGAGRQIRDNKKLSSNRRSGTIKPRYRLNSDNQNRPSIRHDNHYSS